ncbi:calreticulin 2, calcium-binding protein [Coccomyxa subellipsoidea C-169]|uniref:Calreticulin n=1 Tax=Coccomyxa subellipsoidea (strain C-169) TaxID=574566 RepID=I0YTB6_COCSC|nr:calreticulin 2, calcium-binding protein [Coccomyxa subellipsoidea C-169]EIE21635.1 calreticulin 2, calcium-binding protein [Coccomyxa subellipsoidea C-169]|eukprot:XP_005646179.1 calreticulin 2, calcium-binding protein [Coccomyxa subellipsoidea C-169]
MAVNGKLLLLSIATIALPCAIGKVHLEERFDESWTERWQPSTWKAEENLAGKFEHTAGDWYGHPEADKGIKTTPDARFYTIWTELEEEFVNKGKDLVLQFSVKHAQNIDCGGGYIKLLPTSSKDKMPDFGGDTPYSVMFGPDICGSTKKVHAILTDKKGRNLEFKPTVPAKTDELTHVYTYILHPNNTYQILIDNEVDRNGTLYEAHDFLLPRQIQDPDAKKPEDWVDEAQIPDPADVKPDDWEQPETILDPEASQPEDWDVEEDGEWEAPRIPNPAYKGEWQPKMIDNPAYKGEWEHPLIDNPEFEDDEEVYLLPPLKFVGFELWQVKSGTIFDNILVTDDVEYAARFAEETWGASKDKEKEMLDAVRAEEEKKRKEEDAAAKAAAKDADDGDDDNDDEADDDAAEGNIDFGDEDEDDEGLHAEL